jgi:hypothetical protein
MQFGEFAKSVGIEVREHLKSGDFAELAYGVFARFAADHLGGKVASLTTLGRIAPTTACAASELSRPKPAATNPD